MTDATTSVWEALNDVMRAVPVVKKSDRNASQGFDFRGIDSVINAVGPALREHGVLVYPQITEHHAKVFTTARGTQMNSVVVLVRYTFVGPDGVSFCTEVPGEAADAGDKAYSKAMSVAFRTALLQTLALPTDEKDPDSETHERAPEPAASRQTKGPTHADKERAVLLKQVETLGLDTADVAQLYLSNYGTDIRQETDADRILQFSKSLEANK